MEECIEPKCSYSNYRKKCIRANSYIEAIAWCKRNKKDHKECKQNYKINKEAERDAACDRYYERLNIKKTPKCVEPKCHFSNFRNKCVKPNPYVEKIAYCGRTNTKRPECQGKYLNDKVEAKTNACKRYNERITYNLQNAKKRLIKKKLTPIPEELIKKKPIKKLSEIKSKTTPKTTSKTTPKKTPMKQSKKMKSPLIITPNRQKRIDDFKIKVAAKKIQKLTMPFINRVTVNISDRVKFYNLLNKYLINTQKVQCLNRIGDNQYSIADGKIKLMKQIGTQSVYGVIYMSKGIEEGELYRFAVKIMKKTSDNKLEIDILEKVTKKVIGNINPHFPIMYKNFECNTLNYEYYLPKVSQKSTYYINLNELASGDLKMFINEPSNAVAKKTNGALAQIFLSILSFHYLGYSHNDAHFGNFLYHKINPGGYIKNTIYGENVYLENVGFLWVIWDFGKANKLELKDNYEFCTDYFRIISAFISEKKPIIFNNLQYGWVKNNFIVPDETTELVIKIFKIYIWILDNKVTTKYDGEKVFFKKILNETNLFIKEKDLPKDAKILNPNNPYLIAK